MSAAIAIAPPLALLRRSWSSRVGVEGHSMEPTLAAGDCLLVDREAYRARVPQAGELVVARDPRAASRWLVKRVRKVLTDGSLLLVGDHPAHAADSDLLGPLDVSALVGRPWFRYWPPAGIGRVR